MGRHLFDPWICFYRSTTRGQSRSLLIAFPQGGDPNSEEMEANPLLLFLSSLFSSASFPFPSQVVVDLSMQSHCLPNRSQASRQSRLIEWSTRLWRKSFLAFMVCRSVSTFHLYSRSFRWQITLVVVESRPQLSWSCFWILTLPFLCFFLGFLPLLPNDWLLGCSSRTLVSTQTLLGIYQLKTIAEE